MVVTFILINKTKLLNYLQKVCLMDCFCKFFKLQIDHIVGLSNNKSTGLKLITVSEPHFHTNNNLKLYLPT